jgi:hypothetical protein
LAAAQFPAEFFMSFWEMNASIKAGQAPADELY